MTGHQSSAILYPGLPLELGLDQIAKRPENAHNDCQTHPGFQIQKSCQQEGCISSDNCKYHPSQKALHRLFRRDAFKEFSPSKVKKIREEIR